VKERTLGNHLQDILWQRDVDFYELDGEVTSPGKSTFIPNCSSGQYHFVDLFKILKKLSGCFEIQDFSLLPQSKRCFPWFFSSGDILFGEKLFFNNFACGRWLSSSINGKLIEHEITGDPLQTK